MIIEPVTKTEWSPSLGEVVVYDIALSTGPQYLTLGKEVDTLCHEHKRLCGS